MMMIIYPQLNEQSKEEQPRDDDILVNELDLERFLSHLLSWNLSK